MRRASLSRESSIAPIVCWDVDLLINWVINPERFNLTTFEWIIFFLVGSVGLPKSNSDVAKDCVPIIVRYPERAIICVNMTDLLLHCSCPAVIIVRVFTLVAFSGPWVSHLHELNSIFEFMIVLDSVCVARCETSVTFIAASSGHWVVLASELLNYAFVLAFAFLSNNSGWHSSQDPQGLGGMATNDPVIVEMQLCIGFLEDGHPPGSIYRWPGTQGSTIPCQWNAIINIDADPLTVHPEVDSESTLVVVFIVPEDSLDSRWSFCESWCSGQEPAITHST